MKYQKGVFQYEGKAKKIYQVEGESDLLWLEFKDSLTAFNAQKKGSFADKGVINKKIAVLIFRYLQTKGIGSHLIADISDRELVCRKLTIIPLEVVVRNWLAGSTAKKFAIEEGTALEKPLVEFYYKKDELNDPFVSDDQALMLKAAKDQAQLDDLKEKALKVNGALIEFFKAIGIRLIDFKIEFGVNSKGEVVLGDEITPDSCRLWDLETNEKLDKDRFRRDLGQVEESYQEVLNRMSQTWEKQL
ncbi:MAG: phosphoribosylaminoimidazolesuccinocarboxamide synthase [Bdellovibrionaceae bacterium]|nr:phosphoribosylaminoimidazolesuccinocarboxamide synthase [Bdellovibrionales bacterium]MCB9083903.1 phosphoribosylaminoimidazolesuccinocarboxamide synthase [Pseudobdellovibrionaceae bacterium]